MRAISEQFIRGLRFQILFPICLALIIGACDTTALETVDAPDARTASASMGAGRTAVLQAPSVGDRVQVVAGGADLFDRPNGTVLDVAPAGAAGVLLRIKNGWAEVDFDDAFDASFLLEEKLELEVTDPPANEPPVAGFNFAATGLEVTFTDTSTDDGAITSWAWDFGDGNSSTSQNPTHTYAAAGTYTVLLTVTDDEGDSDAASQDVTVSEVAGGPPTAGFSFTTNGLTASFTDTSTDEGSIVSWNWDFGDGGSSANQNPSHAYGAAGTYTVMLTVTDDAGEMDTATEMVTVNEPGGGGGPVLVGLFGCSHALGLIQGMNSVMPELWTPSIDLAEHYGGNTIDDYALFLQGVWNDFDGMLDELQAAVNNDPTANPLIIFQPCARGRNPDTIEPSDTEKEWIEIIANEVTTRVAGAFDYTFIVIPQPDYDPPGTCRKVGENTPTAMYNLGVYAQEQGLADPPFSWAPLSLAGGEIEDDNCHASDAGKVRQANTILNDWLLPTYGN